MTNNPSSPPPASGSCPIPSCSHFPAHNEPRVWILSAGDSPIGISLTRQLLAHGDHVVTGITPSSDEREDARRANFEKFLEELNAEGGENGWREKLEPVELDIRLMSSCQVAIATAIAKFGRADILFCCSSQAIIGTVEELAASKQTQALVKDQFETNYFGPVNLIKAVLPQMRKQKAGHILVLGGITGHIGTPGLGVYCAAGWALEGFCDSIAYEIAPFNIRLTILQCNIEVGILSNLVTSVPRIYPAYSRTTNHAPLFRGILNDILSRLPSPAEEESTNSHHPSPSCSASSTSSEDPEIHPEKANVDTNLHPLSANTIVSLYPPLSPAHLDSLTAETIHAITAIGGHENPPARHLVSFESVASVKEKLKTISEELEDFIGCSSAVDIGSDENAMRVVSEETTAQANVP